MNQLSKCTVFYVAVLTGACGGAGVGGSSSSSGTGSETGIPLDQVPCNDAMICTVDEDCCPALDQGAMDSFPTVLGCGPNGYYPNRWDCVSGECVNLGCDDQASSGDPGACPLGFECHPVDGVNLCIQVCTDDEDCVSEIGDYSGMTECLGESDDNPPMKYCVEPPV